MKQPRRIAIRLGENYFMGRILLGCLRAARQRDWLVSLGENSPTFMQRCGMRGIILADSKPIPPRDYASAGIRVVQVLSLPDEGVDVSVLVDHEAVGRMAGEHLLSRGFRHFATAGYPTPSSRLRVESFRRTVGPHAISMGAIEVASLSRPEELDSMVGWLQSLPKPAGLFAFDDAVGAAVSRACALGHTAVPSDLAIVSVNDDGLHTLASTPELSSIRIPWEKLGECAIDQLAAVMDRRTRRGISRVLIAPSSVVVRGSTDVTVIDDPIVSAAAAFVQQNAVRPITVGEVADAIAVGRRVLERSFRRVLGRSVLSYINAHRIERAKRLLEESDLRVSDIATTCGFQSRVNFHRVFARITGQSPERFRRLRES